VSESVRGPEAQALAGERRSGSPMHRDGRIGLLQEMSEALGAPERVADLLEILVERSLALFGADVALVVRPGDGRTFDVAALYTTPSIAPEELRDFPNTAAQMIAEGWRPVDRVGSRRSRISRSRRSRPTTLLSLPREERSPPFPSERSIGSSGASSSGSRNRVRGETRTS